MSPNDLRNLLEEMGLRHIVVRNNNIQACCPNHDERRPSWGISINEPHFHGCFSCGFKGTLYTLLLKKGVSQARAKNIAGEYQKTDFPMIERRLKEKVIIEESFLYPYSAPEGKSLQFLKKRGINERVIEQAHLLYAADKKRILFPWYYRSQLVGVTGRTILSDPSIPKTLPMFGTKKGEWLYLPLGKIYSNDPLLWLVEGELDALKLICAGYLNVAALGFGFFTAEQKNLVLNFSTRSVMLAFDDDEPGERLRRDAVSALSGKKTIYCFRYEKLRDIYPHKKLDPGELSCKDLRNTYWASVKNLADWQNF